MTIEKLLVEGEGIEGVHTDSDGVAHTDHRRDIYVAFNGSLGGISTVGQIKALVMREDCRLGGHFHTYQEAYLVVGSGDGIQAMFCLEDVNSGNKEVYELRSGDRIAFPGEVAHVVFAREGSTLVGFDSEPYVPGRSDHVHDMPWADAYNFQE